MTHARRRVAGEVDVAGSTAATIRPSSAANIAITISAASSARNGAQRGTSRGCGGSSGGVGGCDSSVQVGGASDAGVSKEAAVIGARPRVLARARAHGSSAERGDRSTPGAPAPGAARGPIDSTARRPAARAPSTIGLGRVAHVPRVRGVGARELERTREDRRIRLRRADLGRGDAPSSSGVRPVSASRSCSETSQLETTTSRSPAARSARSAGTASGRRRSAARPAARRVTRSREVPGSAGSASPPRSAVRSVRERPASRPSSRCAR